MPFSRPSLTALQSQARADIEAALPGTDPSLRGSPLWVLAMVAAGMAHGQYGYLDWIARQAVPYTSTGEYLEAWGAMKGIYRKAASAATGAITMSGADGTVVSAGTEFSTADRMTLTTDSTVTISGGVATVQATMETVGAAGNITSGTQLNLSVALPGLDPQARAGSFSGGTDIEQDEAFRSRVLFQYQNPPQGGARSDYVEWALQVPGVTRAWCAANGFGAGTVVVYVMLDAANSGTDGFPIGSDGISQSETRLGQVATGDQLTVANHIHPLQPATAMVFVCAPIASPVDFTFTGLAGASAALRAQIEQTIDDTFVRYTGPGGIVDLSDLEAAIASLNGTRGFVMTSPAANVQLSPGNLPVRGTVTYT